MSRLTEIEARLEAATLPGGDWFYDEPNMIVWESSNEDAEQVAQGVGAADGLFIALAPGDIAYLLERVRVLEASVRNWEIWANNLPSREDTL